MSDAITSASETTLEPLPEEWAEVNVGDICDQHQETIAPSSDVEGVYVGLEHIESANPRLTKWGRPADVRSGKTKFRSGDILYGKLRPYLDKAVLADREGICSTDILVFRCRDGRALPEFLVNALHTRQFIDHAIRTTHGVNHPRTSWASLGQFVLPLPPLGEQRRIARVLSTIQRAIETQDKVIAAARELKRSLMKHLFTYGPVTVTEASRVPLKETELGPVPDHWKVASLGEICQGGIGFIQTGPFGSQLHASDYEPSGAPVVMPKNILPSGRVELTSIARVGPQTRERLARHALTIGDIVFARRGELGRRALITSSEQGWMCGTGCLLIRVAESKVMSAYLFQYLGHPAVIRRLAADSIGTTMANLNGTILRNLPIAFPGGKQQERIAAVLASVQTKIGAEEKRKAALQALFKTTLHHLMTGKIRV